MKILKNVKKSISFYFENSKMLLRLILNPSKILYAKKQKVAKQI